MYYKTKWIGRVTLILICTKSWRIAIGFSLDTIELSLMWIHFYLVIIPKGFKKHCL